VRTHNKMKHIFFAVLALLCTNKTVDATKKVVDMIFYQLNPSSEYYTEKYADKISEAKYALQKARDILGKQIQDLKVEEGLGRT